MMFSPLQNPSPAYFVNGVLSDASAFYAAACHPQQHVVVEACAGAGKTWMLVSRILRALLEDTAPHEILAITFTKKAAAEMSQRLQEWLEDFSNPARSDAELNRELSARGIAPGQLDTLRPQLRGLYARLLQAEKPLQIRTFHSWFAQMTRSAPAMLRQELGLPSSYELLEDDQQAVDQVWRVFWKRLLGDAALRDDYQAVVREHGRSSTQKALAAALAKRGEFVFADRAGVVAHSVPHFSVQCPGFESLTEPQERLQAPACQDILWAAAKAMGSAKAPGNQDKASKMALLCSQGHWFDASQVLLNKGGVMPAADKVGGLSDAHNASVQTARELGVAVVQAQLQHKAWLHQGRMTRLTRALLADFAALKRERGWVDMGDLETVALKMLADPALGAWLSQMLDVQIRHVLIDEFQDTNPMQWQVLHGWLQSYAGQPAQAPRVFMVGDPKQSIYRFRGADPYVFEAAKQFVQTGLQGQWLACDHTRRNAQAVVSVVNGVMQAAALDARIDGYRAHSTASPGTGAVLTLPKLVVAKAGPTVASAPWRDSLTQPRALAQEHVRQLEARQVAQWLAAEIAQGRTPGSFLVLARKNERLARMQEELRALAVPSSRMDQDDLYQAPEVQDIVALLEALAWPHRSNRLARALKSPIFGVSDAQLLELAQACKQAKTTWWQAVQQSGLCFRDGRLVADVLRTHQGWVRSLPVHDALSMLLHDADVLASYGMQVCAALFARVQANLTALVGSSLSLLGGRFVGVDAFIRALKNAQVKAPLVADAQAVQLLTIHKAKGLEADTVVLLDTDAPPANKDSMGVLLDWPGGQAHPRHFVFFTKASAPPASLIDAQALEARAMAREDVHALYVAMTRARERLVISSSEGSREAGNSWYAQIMASEQVQPVPASQAETSLAERALSGSTCTLLQLPVWRPAPKPARDEPTGSPTDEPAQQQALARLGQGIHRLLQWAPMRQPGQTWHPGAQALAAIGREFDLSESDCERAAQAAQAMYAGQAAWLWDSTQVQWAANEVDIQAQGQLLRLDRLVQLRAPDAQGRQWWVVDYKLHPQPLSQPDLCQQLRGYGQAVSQQLPTDGARAVPAPPVGMAFVSASGQLWVLEA